MNEEMLMVLKMVEEGKVSADKAKELIDALGNTSKNTESITSKRYEDKFLRVEVLGHDGDKVNVKLPIKVIREVLKVTGKLPISKSIEGMDGIDIDELMNTIVSCLDNEVMGEIVDICSSDGDTVKVVVD
ncbi:MAG: SHOCT-like domain-containing protein [Clostridium sp.]